MRGRVPRRFWHIAHQSYAISWTQNTAITTWPHWMQRFWLSVSLWLVVGAVLWFANGAVNAQSELDELQRLAVAQGEVRVIVQLDTAFTPVGQLPPVAMRSQQDRIAQLQNELVEQLAGNHAGVVRHFRSIPYSLLHVDEIGLLALAQNDLIVSITEDRMDQLLLESSVPNIQGTWAHEDGYRGTGQAIAVIDTGVDLNHDAFAQGGRIVAEGCFSTTSLTYNTTSVCPGGVNASTEPGSGMDCVRFAENLGYAGAAEDCTHGTHVAGIVAGYSVGQSVGVAPDADLIAIQSASLHRNIDHMTFFISDQIAAMEYVLQLHLSGIYDVAAINLSLGGNVTYSGRCDNNEPARKAVIDNLRSAGIATIIASGNSGATTGIAAPACISSAISVGATYDGTDQVADFSNVGPQLDLLAPGTFIRAALPGNRYGSRSGTSMATPHVAGAWALLRQAMPTATIDEILSALLLTGQPIDDVSRYDATPLKNEGSGRQTIPRVNVYDAIEVLKDHDDIPSTPTRISTPVNTATTRPTKTAPAPTATPIPANTPIDLPTATSSTTAVTIQTPTATATSLGKPSATATPTASSTVLALPTIDLFPTATPTITPSPTLTSIAAASATPTPTPSIAPVEPITAETTVYPGVATTLAITTTSGSQISLAIPADAVRETYRLQLAELTQPTMPLSEATFANIAFTLNAEMTRQFVTDRFFTRPITVTLAYEGVPIDSDMDGGKAGMLALYHLEPQAEAWQQTEIRAIAHLSAQQRLIVTLVELGEYALFLTPDASSTYQTYLPIVSRQQLDKGENTRLCQKDRCISP